MYGPGYTEWVALALLSRTAVSSTRECELLTKALERRARGCKGSYESREKVQMDASIRDFALRSRDFDPGPEDSPRRASPLSQLYDVIATLKREWRFPVIGTLVGATLGLTYVALAPTLYKSSSRIIIDTAMGRYLQSSKIVDEPGLDDAQIGSQIYVISSESNILPVVKSLDLTHDPEFVGSPNEKHEGLTGILNRIYRFLGWDEIPLPTGEDNDRLEQRAADAVFQNLTVYREDVPNVINITFSSRDPNRAAQIANALADQYISSALQSKLNSTRVVSQWLQDRMAELKSQTAEAEIAVQNYKTANNIVSTGKGILNSEQLSDLNAQLANARIAVAEAKARLDGASKIAGEKRNEGSAARNPSGISLNNADILKLRSEYRDVSSRAAELESSLGAGHAAVIRLKKKLDELRAAIRDQEQLIADSYANEYQRAKARESELSSAVAQLMEIEGSNSKARIKLRDLESSAETSRALYNTFLQKYREINTLQEQGLPIENARIMTKAVPSPTKSYKKSIAVLGGSVLLGLALGIGGALGKEWSADVFRNPRSIEDATDIHCSMLPLVTRVKNIKGSSQFSLEEYVLDAPFSRFSENLRTVKTAIFASKSVNGGRVVGIISSLPKEGKTTVAANLGALMVASSGARTLLIDTDMHLRQLSARLAPQAQYGLIEALVDPSRLDKLVHRKNRSGLDVLPCVLPSRVPNAADLLGSPKMERLLTAARGTYDCIILEVAPIMSVADVKLIEKFVDVFVFVIEWGQTKRTVVSEALNEAGVIRNRIVDVVLNKADPVALKSIEAYKGNRFQHYYQE